MISLDGYMEMPGGSLDWVSVDEELLRFINNLKRQIGGYVCGRGMYENNQALLSTADTQPMQDYEVELAQNWKQTPKIVFSSTRRGSKPTPRWSEAIPWPWSPA
jgi:hypothetical protein